MIYRCHCGYTCGRLFGRLRIAWHALSYGHMPVRA